LKKEKDGHWARPSPRRTTWVYVSWRFIGRHDSEHQYTWHRKDFFFSTLYCGVYCNEENVHSDHVDENRLPDERPARIYRFLD